MNEAMAILEELLELLSTFDGGMDVTETIPAQGDKPALTRSISAAGMLSYFVAVEKANKSNVEPDVAVLALGKSLLSKARWHEVDT